jgi:hypothetical protein
MHSPVCTIIAALAADDLIRAFDEFVRETMAPPAPGACYPTIDPTAYVAIR